MLKLVIGNKNYSSWSLRPWFFLKVNKIPFQEIRIPLDTPETKAQIARYTSSGCVPILLDGDLTLWDSMAIVAHLAEVYPHADAWPETAAARALARSITAEMHSGFQALRDELPQNIRAITPLPVENQSEDCRRQITRIQQIWEQCRVDHGGDGPWLFGRFSIADAFYAPVVMRFLTYQIAISPICAAYVQHVRSCDAMSLWIQDAANEAEHLDLFPDSQ